MGSILVQLGGAIGMNFLLMGLKRVSPKIPSWAVPFVNLGLTMGGVYTGVITPDDAVAITGGSTVIHNVTKNIVRGDKFGEPSRVIKGALNG